LRAIVAERVGALRELIFEKFSHRVATQYESATE
jgi:hypothetical protein